MSGSIVVNTPSTVAGISGPVRRSVTGLVIGLEQESRTTPTTSIVLHAVEVRGPTHVQLSEALGDPGLLRIDSGDLTVRCRVQYRIFDAGNIQATIIYADPALNHPNFDTVRRMIDAALQDRFPGKTIEIGEAHDYGDRTDFVDRELPPRDAQEEYRGQDPANREAKAAYADPLGDVLGHSMSLARVRQLTDDLSGKYGPYWVHFTTVDDDGMITLEGFTLNGPALIAETHPDVARDSNGNPIAFLLKGAITNDDGAAVGDILRTIYRATDGNLVVYEDWLTLKKEFRRKGFSNALVSQLLPYYQRLRC